jgi:hypothetical protein
MGRQKVSRNIDVLVGFFKKPEDPARKKCREELLTQARVGACNYPMELLGLPS